MDFSPDALNAHVKSMGHDFGWRRAYACPCVSASSGAARDDCINCDGKGVIWQPEKDCRLGFTNQSAQKAMRDFGAFEMGDALLTLPSDEPCYAAGRYDRFRNKNSTHSFSFNLKAGLNDRLRFTISRFERVFWLDADQNIVEGALPEVDDLGVLSWPASPSPAPGVTFSLSGERYDEFYAFLDLPATRNVGIMGLPRKLAVRRFDLFAR